MTTDINMLTSEIFTKVQYKKTSHSKYRKILMSRYEIEDSENFWNAFIGCLKIPLTVEERNPNVENILDFAAKFAISLSTADETSGKEPIEPEMCPFLERLFKFLLAHTDAKKAAVRFRICHFLNMLLNSMEANAFLNDDLWDTIMTTMMKLLLDRQANVRAQAVLALQRLQEPNNDECTVIKVYVFHLAKDPNPKVRRMILTSIAKNRIALKAALSSTQDVNDLVRKMAYEFISKFTVTSLTIAQREKLLNCGLKDKSEIVRKCVANTLLPNWLDHMTGDYKKLLRALDPETATDTAILAFNALVKDAPANDLIEQIPLIPEKKLISFENLTSDAVVFWRCVVEHFHRESCHEQVEACLPELSAFCDYIRQLIASMDAKEGDTLTQRFILLQLFEIVKTYDLSDEVGRKQLRDLILDTLTNDNCTLELIASIVKYFEIVVPNVEERLNSLTFVINTIRTPATSTSPIEKVIIDEGQNKLEKARLRVKLNELEEEEYDAMKKRDFLKAQKLKEQLEAVKVELEALNIPEPVIISEEICELKSDPDTINKCLTIMCGMGAAPSVKTLTPTLRTLLDNLAIRFIDNEHTMVHILALKAIGICCLLDEEVAKQFMMLFYLQLSSDDDIPQIWIIALKTIFDLLLAYGLETFEIEPYGKSQDVSNVADRTDGNENRNFIKIIITLLDNVDQELRTTATEGLCKLLLHGRISGAHLISRLIVLMHNPMTEDDVYMRDCLCYFFSKFPTIPDGQEILGQSLLPTLKTLANASDASPLQGIEPNHVTDFILGLTSSRWHKHGHESYVVHNQLALEILAEVLDENSVIDRITLLRSLKDLEIRFEDDTLKSDVREATEKILESLGEGPGDKTLISYVEQFKTKFETGTVAMEVAPTQNENENEEEH